MGNHYQTSSLAIEGWFLGWADDRTPHRRVRLLTDRGERVMKVVKSLRCEIQNWEPGLQVSLWCQQRVNVAKGKTKIKIERLLSLSDRDRVCNQAVRASSELPPSPPMQTIRVCQGSSCRKRGSKEICQAMASYLQEHDLTDRVQIKSVKCMHQCKNAPHAIVPHLTNSQDDSHYRHVSAAQILKIMEKHFPAFCASHAIGKDLIEQLNNLTYEFVY
jgi:(2Fe-2S) ferredoxin